ncbi:hypothetical protein AVEN_214214-1 [Araneus ventricosus]|uniref:Tc1-like transposase DDE domain-containing protein n=1 Tax=Araneus ventricosus TaxID=182803 RepID=A0A4Y2IUA4_ARAVE|nr:hypothetical protein AVEN_214214-1 [Araneus ventricosus]
MPDLLIKVLFCSHNLYSNLKAVDYHEEMNSKVFKKWFLDLLRGLDEPCVIVVDNASYHSAYGEKVPSTKTKKTDIIAWFLNKNIPHKATKKPDQNY